MGRPQLISGFSLIELLVTLFILSIGLLGYLQAELVALKNTQMAYMKSLEISKNNVS